MFAIIILLQAILNTTEITNNDGEDKAISAEEMQEKQNFLTQSDIDELQNLEKIVLKSHSILAKIQQTYQIILQT